MTGAASIYELPGGVLCVRFGAGSLNPLDVETLRSLDAALRDAARAGTAVVLAGHGDAFSCGGDLRSLAGLPPVALSVGLDEMVVALHAVARTLHTLPVPTIAAVERVAAGAGLSLMALCDFSVTARSARLVPAYGDAGLSPDGGLTHTLPRLIGVPRAKECLLLGRVLDGPTALDWGLVTALCDDGAAIETAAQLAADIAARPVAATRATLALLRGSMQSLLDLEEALDQEQAALGACARGDEAAGIIQGLWPSVAGARQGAAT